MLASFESSIAVYQQRDYMKFSDVAQIFNKIEIISSRLEITNLLSELLKKSNPQEAKIIAYFSLGELNPPYVGTKFNFAEKNAIKVITKILNISEQEIKERYKEIGDLGSILEHGSWRISSNLSVEQVYDRLIEIEQISGTGSQDLKQEKVFQLLKDLDPVSAKYIIRILTATLRLGFSDMTLIDAFSWMIKGDKSLRKEIEEQYNLCADIGLVAYNAKMYGEKRIEKRQIKVGIPVRPAAAERLPSAQDVIDKIGKCIAQPKLDGFRLQVHLDKTGEKPVVKFFSRNLIDMSYMFPDLVEEVLKIDAKELICEGEAVAYDINTGSFVPFQETVKRKRKHGIEDAITELPLKLFLFDLLYLNGKSTLNSTQIERREKLENLFKNYQPDDIHVIQQKEINNASELENYLLENIQAGLEGVVVKKLDSIYQAGKRNFNWIKLKREVAGHLNDTIDCVILGYYHGTGKRAQFGIGAFLVGIYNKEKDIFQTIAKVGTGMTDEEWIDLKKRCDKIKDLIQPTNTICDKNLSPDVWTYPEIVCTIRADEITLSPAHTAGKTEKNLGFALRFPRFINYRPDKSATESTTIHEVQEMYDLQYKK